MDWAERGLYRVATPTESIAQRPKPITAVSCAHRTRFRFTKPIDAFEMAYQGWCRISRAEPAKQIAARSEPSCGLRKSTAEQPVGEIRA